MGGIDFQQLGRAGTRLGEAVLDPSLWPELMDGICGGIGASGAGLLQRDVRTADEPRTASIKEQFQSYFRDGWHARDLRARGGPLWLRGQAVVTEEDIVTPEEMRRDPFYNECVRPLGFEWWAGVGFRAGSALWVLAIQRTFEEGAFDSEHKRALEPFARLLTETATLSEAVNRSVLAGMTNALNLVPRPAMILDGSGFVLDSNASADRILNEEIKISNRHLLVRDRTAQRDLDTLIVRMRTTPDTAVLDVAPIVVRRADGTAVIIRVLPISGAARNPFLGARALLLLSDLPARHGPDPGLLGRAFGLTPAEAKLASIIAEGIAPNQAADQLGLARETVRNQLKAIFAKTDTHRQAELVALLSRLRE